MTYVRTAMTLVLRPQIHRRTFPSRPVRADDAEELAILLHASFRGGIDDEGETFGDAAREIETLHSGGYGDFLPDCSFVVEGDDRLRAACLVTWFEPHTAPLVAFTMTHPEDRRRGMARHLLQRSIEALLARGETRLTLVVTPGNDAAVALYRTLGFREWTNGGSVHPE
jgi:ribosomal protein S18 acetylase RimI-like enzyme